MSDRLAELVQSGSAGRLPSSTRSGFLPIPLDRVPLEALAGMGVYLRTDPAVAEGVPDAEHPGFSLYSRDSQEMDEAVRARLLERGVRFIYIRIADQSAFRRRTEETLERIAADPAITIAQRSALVYETSVELINELLTEPELVIRSPRLGHISRAVTTLVINDPSAFTHLFAASQHDFYTATHMVNVGTWMVPLAWELGYRDPEILDLVCQAGLLHDMGKTAIPEEILNKSGALTAEDWALIMTHPEAGHRYLSQFEGMHPIVLRVAWEHHERMNGTGYPRRLEGKDIHPISRICAVVDSYDAMTAVRPFRKRALAPEEALEIIRRETPMHYDQAVSAAWMRIMQRDHDVAPATDAIIDEDLVARPACRRRHARRSFHCNARAHQIVNAGGVISRGPGFPVVAHSISRGGIGFLTQRPIDVGAFVCIFLQMPGWERRPLNGQTVRCRTYDDSWYEIGIAFCTPDVRDLPAVEEGSSDDGHPAKAA